MRKQLKTNKLEQAQQKLQKIDLESAEQVSGGDFFLTWLQPPSPEDSFIITQEDWDTGNLPFISAPTEPTPLPWLF
ncbi:MAG: hypothetical protein WBF90_26820 [Rivularia sp. (in: cyanobacteria)]|jgi:hypothetical protein